MILIEGPADYWAAILLTIDREAFGHDPRPRAADEGIASLIHEMDRMDPDWRKRWDH